MHACVCFPQAGGVNGRYFSRGALAESSTAAQDVQKQRRLWELSCQACGIQEGQYLQYAPPAAAKSS